MPQEVKVLLERSLPTTTLPSQRSRMVIPLPPVGPPMPQLPIPSPRRWSFWDAVGVLGVVAVGAAVVGTAVVAAITEAYSRPKPSPTPVAPPPPPDEYVELTADHALVLAVRIETEDEDGLWAVARDRETEIKAELQAVAAECLGPEFEVEVVFQKGSFWTAFVIRLKEGVKKVKVNVSEFNRKMRAKIEPIFKKYWSKVKAVGQSVWKVVEKAAPVVSSILSIISFFLGGGSA